MSIHIDRLSRDSLYGEHLLGLKFTAGGQDYMLTGKIGDGAIGIVRKANNVKTNTTVAVKFLAPETKYIDASSIDDIYRRFKREGQRGIELDHANLVKMIAYEENEKGENFQDEGETKPVNPFIVMEYIAGRTLEDYLKMSRPSAPRGSLRINAETLYIASEIAEGLVHLHKHRIVHRDIKPANIFLSKFIEGQMPRAVKFSESRIEAAIDRPG